MDMRTSDFDYELPQEMIAQTPVEPRDASRLLVVERGTGSLAHRRFSDIAEYLRPGDLLVGNDSRTIPARLHGAKESGGAVEIFLLKPVEGGAWQCLVGGKGMRPGVRAKIARDGWDITATVVSETEGGGRVINFEPSVSEWLWDVGETPLPPYIHEPLADAERYQTVYSRIEGSVASSTAGLHFTPELLVQLRDMGVRFATVTLHIGLDTFRPVQVENIEEHRIHREWAELSAETAKLVNETALGGGRVIAIGTTVVRTLESGAKIALGFRPCDDVPEGVVCGWQRVAAFEGETDLFIKPGHAFRAVDAMVTNFHLPKSTLLMLVAAFAGKGLMERAYAQAIWERYRFYSFGDAMFIL
jgi:S-adenosylmethionine:tRNA ribosyltransferase-isomerase